MINRMGQVFTPSNIVNLMVELIKNKGAVLEPSAGDGAFLSALSERDVDAVELSPVLYERLCVRYPFANVQYGDFFDLSISKKYSTIIGNPPYVRYQDILLFTKKRLTSSLFDRRTNLYLFFIERCVRLLEDRGEMIFITPRELITSHFCKKIKSFYANGRVYNFLERLRG